ncbi:MAG: thioredoxin family protein [Candidatus Wallbacteria bacterium]|nr:thioredoxin family protein [Candidatus Wallbacteria bacterium]
MKTCLLAAMLFFCLWLPAFGSSNLQEVSFGSEIDLNDYITSGSPTVFEFFSPYCGACNKVAPVLQTLAAKSSEITVIKVNINRSNINGIDWTSPVVKKFKLTSVPYFIVSDRQGNLVSGSAAQDLINEWLNAPEPTKPAEEKAVSDENPAAENNAAQSDSASSDEPKTPPTGPAIEENIFAPANPEPTENNSSSGS